MQLYIVVCEITLLTSFIQAQPNEILVESCILPLYSVSTILNLYWCHTNVSVGIHVTTLLLLYFCDLVC